MPSEKPRSKEDTWTPEELEKSLKDIRGDKRKPRDRDEKREHRRKDEDRERRHRNQDNGEGHKERRTKDDVRKSSGDRRSNHSLDKELDEIKKEERRMKDDDRDERHRRKREERKAREEEEQKMKSTKSERVVDDENNHNGRDEEKKRHKDKDGHRDRTEDRERRHRDREHSDRNGENEKGRRHDSEDRRKERNRDDTDRRRSNKDKDDRRRSHKDDEDRRRSHKDDDDRRRSHRDEDDRRRSDKDNDDRRRSHSDKDDRRSSHKDEERRRSHKDGEERKRSHRDDDDRRHKSDRERRHSRDRDPEEDGSRERRSNRDPEDQDSSRKHREKKKEEKADREKDGKRNRSEDKRRRKDQVTLEGEETGSEKAEPREATDTGADNYEDDFEDYEEDFEDDAEDSDNDKPQNEVDDVLKALDAENDRLMAESRRSNASDSTELSDERFRSSQTPNKQRTFINFVSAKQMVLSDKASNKTRTRGRDLLQLIDLDVSAFDMFDLPPVKEYDLYIRNYGRTDTTQVYVQTNDDNIDRDIQTDEIESQEKWSQHPSEETAASGSGNGVKDEEDVNSLHQVQTEDLAKLSKFIHKAGQTISILLEEESGDGESQMTSQSNISVSQGFSQLTVPPFLLGRTVSQTSFSPHNPNLLLTIYNYDQDQSIISNDVFSYLGILCVWNISEPSVPQKILVCDSIPSCCCFSPFITSLIFAGMHDGSLVLWDTREPASLHQTIEREGREFCLRYPTYNTAGILGDENHQSSVVTVTPTLPPVHSSSSSTSLVEESGGASYQIVSVDESGCVNLWVVAEIASPDLAGSESDLGLSPGGKVKLLRSSSFILDNPIKDAGLQSGLKVTCLNLNPGDPNLFVVGTDGGFIIHGARFGAKPIPRVYLGLTESPLDVTSIDFSPFCNPCFLAGCADGIVRLYQSTNAKPLMVWPPRDMNTRVISVQWSSSRPGVFFILYDNSTLAVYDLVETDSRPSAYDQIQSGRALGMKLSPDGYCRGKGQPNKRPHMVLQLDNGKSEIHAITKTFVEQQPFEEDFLNSYLDRF